MKTKQARLLEMLEMPKAHYVIPVYQRVYSWTDRHCAALWDDALRVGETGNTHFVGTMLYKPEGEEEGMQHFALVDGQQRLATLVILLAALRDYLNERDSEKAALLSSRFLVISSGKTPQSKLVLSRNDRETLNALVMMGELPEEENASVLILENYDDFRTRMEDPDFDPDILLAGLALFNVVVVELEEGDKPQLVFESLNAKGVPLRTSDLIRNLLFTQMGYDEQVRLFEHYWEPLEAQFDEIENKANADRKTQLGIPPRDRRVKWEGVGLDAALHAWLVKNAPNIRPHTRADLYGAFKTYIADQPHISLVQLLESINISCTEFAADFDSQESKMHLEWAIGKPEGFGGRYSAS